MNRTIKRLLSASRLGINFDYGDGHRWINLYEEEVTDNETMFNRLQRNGFDMPILKVYGNIIECLDYVDELLKRLNEKTLEEQYDDYNDWGLDENQNY